MRQSVMSVIRAMEDGQPASVITVMSVIPHLAHAYMRAPTAFVNPITEVQKGREQYRKITDITYITYGRAERGARPMSVRSIPPGLVEISWSR